MKMNAQRFTEMVARMQPAKPDENEVMTVNYLITIAREIANRPVKKLPRCERCDRAIRGEYMQLADGAMRHVNGCAS